MSRSAGIIVDNERSSIVPQCCCNRIVGIWQGQFHRPAECMPAVGCTGVKYSPWWFSGITHEDHGIIWRCWNKDRLQRIPAPGQSLFRSKGTIRGKHEEFRVFPDKLVIGRKRNDAFCHGNGVAAYQGAHIEEWACGQTMGRTIGFCHHRWKSCNSPNFRPSLRQTRSRKTATGDLDHLEMLPGCQAS